MCELHTASYKSGRQVGGGGEGGEVKQEKGEEGQSALGSDRRNEKMNA